MLGFCPGLAAPAFPSFPVSKKNGRHQFEVLATDLDDGPSQSALLARQSWLEGEEEPIKIYMRGPYHWQSIAETEESDAVFEGSGVIGWLQYLQVKEQERLDRDDPEGSQAAYLREIRDRARRIALGSLDAPTWGASRSGVFAWLQRVAGQAAKRPPKPTHRCRSYQGAPSRASWHAQNSPGPSVCLRLRMEPPVATAIA